MGVYWKDVEKTGFNPITKTEEKTMRRKLYVDYELPLGEAYAKMVEGFVCDKDDLA